jgi:hypothetical protein
VAFQRIGPMWQLRAAGDGRSAAWAAAPGAAIGERPEQADGPTGRTTSPSNDGDEEEKQRDGTDHPEQNDRKRSGEQAEHASQYVLSHRAARER